ncbi:MAG TPA: thiamine-phosphate kinase [Terriglobia bacterium]|nr:thiamine-phosphate kinase [Terriglobia bacterium]
MASEQPFQNEDEFVRWLRKRATGRVQGLRLGIGDDAALASVPSGREIVVTTDLSIEGVHFSTRLHPPESIGHRALARSLSDVAAMGAVPKYALVALALSKRASRRWVESLYEGMWRLARRYRVGILGGDTACYSGKTLLDVAVIGEVARGKALLRSGAKPGDRLFVAGTLGLSAWGLELLKARAKKGIAREALRAHLYPEPQCALGQHLAKEGLASAAIDVSDGLSTDLHRLCEASGVGARLRADRIPRPHASANGRLQARLLQFALHGGEDYRLLFTSSAAKVRRIPSSFRGIRIHQIGEALASRRIVLMHEDGAEQFIVPQGYDHFRKS